jgi:hypothetical protein
MVTGTEKRKGKGQELKVGSSAFKALLGLLLLSTFSFQLSTAHAQQPQTSVAPIFSANAKYVQGVGPGYWPTAGAGLTLNLAPGTAYCGNPPVLVTYAGGSLAMTDGATNYVYLDPAASCAPAKNTTGFAVGVIPLAKVVTAGGTITSVTDARGWFAPLPCTMGSTGAVTCAALGTNQNITLAPSGTGFAQIGDKLLTPYHAFADWGAQDLELISNYDPIQDLLKDPSQSAWDVCISCNADGPPGGEVSAWYAAPTAETPSFVKKWSIGYDGIERVEQNILAPRLNNVRYANQFPTIQAAIDDLPSIGGMVIIPPGEYFTDTIVLPPSPKIVHLVGAGIRATTLRANAPNIPILRLAAGDNVEGDVFSGFSVQAHASGSTGPAIDMSGMRAAVFEDIGYLSNYSANFNSFFHLASHPGYSYGNVIRHPVVQGQTGPPTVFLFDNGGMGDADNNPNANAIYDLWVNGNSGITTVIDARRSAATKVSMGLVESNPGAVVLIPGSHTVFENVWIESNAAVPVVPTTGTDGSSSHVKFRDNYMGGCPWTLTVPVFSDDWDISGNTPAGCPVVADSGQNNIEHYGSTFVSGRTSGELVLNNSTTAAVTVQDAGDTVTRAAHPFQNGNIVRFSETANGITAATTYHVCNRTTDTFQLDTVSAACGSLLDITSDGSNYVAGGSIWGLRFDGATGLYPNSFFVYDKTNSLGRLWFQPTQNALVAPTTGGLALRLVPYDDTTPTNAVFSLTDAGQTTTKLAFRKNGQINSSVPSGTAPFVVASTTPVANLSLSGGTGTSVSVAKLSTPVNTVTFSSTPNFDASLANTQKITLTGNVTSSTLSNASAGQSINFIVCQDATGGRTFAWPTNVLGGMAIGSTASKCSAQDFIFDGTNAYALSSGVTNM